MKFNELKNLILLAEEKTEETEKESQKSENSKFPFYAAIGTTAVAATGVLAATVYSTNVLTQYASTLPAYVDVVATAGAYVVPSVVCYSVCNRFAYDFMVKCGEFYTDFIENRHKDKVEKAMEASKEESIYKQSLRSIEHGNISEFLLDKEVEQYKKDKENYIVLDKDAVVMADDKMFYRGLANINEQFKNKNNLIILSVGFGKDIGDSETKAYAIVQSDYIATSKDKIVIDKNSAQSTIILHSLDSNGKTKIEPTQWNIDLSNMTEKDARNLVSDSSKFASKVSNGKESLIEKVDSYMYDADLQTINTAHINKNNEIIQNKSQFVYKNNEKDKKDNSILKGRPNPNLKVNDAEHTR